MTGRSATRCGLGLLGVWLTLAGGCGGVSEDVPLETLRRDVQTMSVAELRSQAQAYHQAAMARQAEMARVTEELRKASAGGKADARVSRLADQATEISNSLYRLLDRYDVFIDALVKRGQDISDLKTDSAPRSR